MSNYSINTTTLLEPSNSFIKAAFAGNLAYLMENFWMIRLALMLIGYGTVIIPCILLVQIIKSRYIKRKDYNGDNIFWKGLRFFAIGQPEYALAVDLSTQDPNKVSERPEDRAAALRKRFVDDCMVLFLYFIGIQTNFVIMGLLQEKIMTQGYSLVSNESIIEKFGDTQFLVFCNRIVALIISFGILAKLWSRLPEHVPPFYSHSYISLSNTLSSWCQYEALKYVSFPTQTVCKASKLIPTMLMGRLVRKQKYTKQEYGMAFCLAFGAALFFLSNHTGKSTHVDSTSVSGILLMIGYLGFDAFTLNWQSKLFDTKPKVSKYQMMLGVNLFSAILCIVSLLEQTTLFSSINFMVEHHDIARDAFFLSLSGTIGQIFIYMTVEKFGPIVFAVIMTIRQIISIVLSSLYFGHGLTLLGMLGLSIAFGSILYSTYNRYFATTQHTKKEIL
uniref:EOG090X05CU n=1 Tax=Rhabditophanes sp. KR3021 TaxID=114890 RepID=A0AC35UHC3_9BILA